jgi:hypothetical protein
VKIDGALGQSLRKRVRVRVRVKVSGALGQRLRSRECCSAVRLTVTLVDTLVSVCRGW